MLLVKTFVGPSSIQGLGCFAAEDITKGQLVWRFDSTVDLIFTEEELKTFPAAFISFLKTYAYTPIDTKTRNYILCADHARHMNHSRDPNLLETPEGMNVAGRDIKAGEELTCDYHQFDQDADSKLKKKGP